MSKQEVKKRELRVLIVDESDQLLNGIRHSAEVLPPQTAVVARLVGDLADMEREMDTWAPTVVLIDAHLPRMDIFDYLQNHLSALVPVIVTSAHLSAEIKRSALAKGAVSYFHKSDDPDELEALLESIFKFSEDSSDRH